MLNSIEGVQAVEVKSTKDLEKISGLILPGGESTTIGKLLNNFDLMEPIKSKINQGMPVWGTCAGMILLAKEIVGEETVHLGLMDIAVRRNAYGSQLDSFKTSVIIPEVSRNEISLVFIRAPWVESISDKVRVLARINDKIIAVEHENMIATSFHPELSDDLCFHEYFVKKIMKWKKLK